MKKANQTTIKTSLPYCLFRVDTRFFKLQDEHNSKIRFLKIETTPNRRTQSSRNIEVIRDRWGIDAHSDVEIYTDKRFDKTEDAESFALKLINDFVMRYRYYDKDAIHLVALTKEDLFGLNVLTDGHGVMSMTFAGGMTIVNPLRNHEISSKLEQSLLAGEEIPFWEELMQNAERYCYQADFRHSILESVIALELIVSQFIREKCAKLGIGKKEVDTYMHDVGITGNIKVTLKMLLQGETLPAERVMEKCKGSIGIRNKIVHEGRKNINATEAKEAIQFGKQMIEFLLTKISTKETLKT